MPKKTNDALRIGMAGIGTVGAAVARLLRSNRDAIADRAGRPIEITAVAARDKTKRRDCDLSGARWCDDPSELATASDVDVVVELMGGAQGSAFELCKAALACGRPVATANKALLAAHGIALAALAEGNRTPLMFEAAVAGGIPVIKTVRESLAGNRISCAQGILNGTCNYILSRMFAEGLDFATVLADAQKLGYAESDPAADVDGHDTAHKLAILAALAFGTAPDVKSIALDGIRRVSPLDLRFAAEMGYRVKLIGSARLTENGLEQRVGPCLVPLSSPLASVDGSLNAVTLRGDAVGEIALSGRGAGGDPTASAVVADLIDIARGRAPLPFSVPSDRLKIRAATPPEKRTGCWYIRLQVSDKPGVVADVSAILRDENISIESLLQHGRSPTDSVPVVLATHETDEAAMAKAIGKISALPAVKESPCRMRIETETI